MRRKEGGRRGGGGERLRVKLEPLTRWSFSFAVLIHPNICGAAAAFAQLAVVFLDVGAAPLSDLACHPRTFEGEGEDMCLRRWTRRNLRLQDQKEKQSFRARAKRAHLPRGPRISVRPTTEVLATRVWAAAAASFPPSH